MPFLDYLTKADLAILLACSIFLITYICLILYFAIHLIKGKHFIFHQKIKVKEDKSKLFPFVSLVVAFRNEAEYLPKLLDCLIIQDYPVDRFEVLLSDDYSTDDSNAIVRDYAKRYPHIRLILTGPSKNKQKTGKKNALFRAIQQSSGEIILATDADCKMGKHWIKSVGGFFSEHPQTQMLIAPVDIISERGRFFSHLQSLEFMSLTGSTAGSAFAGKPIMCNGANLAFRRKSYLSVKECMPGEKFASGDDMFLLECMQRNAQGSISFLKSEKAIVKTHAVKSLREFVFQRVRWSSKARGYTNRFTIFVGATVASLNLMLAALMLYVPFRADELFIPVILFFFMKLIADFILVFPIAKFLHKTNLLLYMPIVSAVYPFYVLLVLLFAIFYRGKWKNRRI